MRIVLLAAVLALGFGTVSGCSDDKTTPQASDPVPPDPDVKGKGMGRIPPPPK